MRPIATSRQQWRHRLDTSDLLNVVAAVVVVASMLSLLLPIMAPPLWQIVVDEAKHLEAGWRTGVGAEVVESLVSSSTVAGVLGVLALPLTLYVRFLVAAVDVHGRRQIRRMAGAWAMGVRSLGASPLSRAAAMTNIVGTLLMAGGVLVVFLMTMPTEQLSPLLSLFPVVTAIIGVAVLGGALVWLAEEARLVRWVARNIGTLFPRTRSVGPEPWASQRCAICDGAALPRPFVVRLARDVGRAGARSLRTSHNPLVSALRRVRRFLARDPLKIVLLAVVILPAALGLSVEVYMTMLAIIAAMLLLFRVFTSNIGALVFVFSSGERVGAALRALVAALGVLLNCMVVIWTVDRGAEMFAGWGLRLDENYAALFLLSSEAVAVVVIVALLGHRLRGLRRLRPGVVLSKSALPLVSLLLAAVVAPWAATFTAFLLGLDFNRGQVLHEGDRGPAATV